MTCAECTKPCPEHGITFCATCHKHPGECNIGDCQSPATHRLVHPKEIRPVCKRHATDSAWQFARVGCSVEEIAHA